MAWYDKFTINNTDRNTLNEIATFVKKEAETEPEEKWIWVEGYKGVDWNMQGYGGFQYELGTEYTVDGEVKECANGFHFSICLEDAFNYKERLTHRFFKVKAYVREEDFKTYGTRPRDYYDPYSYRSYREARIDKLAAQKIILTEEITETEVMLKKIQNEYPEIETFDDVKTVRASGYKTFVKKKYTDKLSKYFSELFVELFIDRFDGNLKSKTNEIIAYMEEGVSKEVAIYLLMK
jgi:hypothetical protein